MTVSRRLVTLTRMMVACAVTLLALATALVSPAGAADRVHYPPGAFTLALSLSRVVPGATVTVTVSGAESGVGVRLTVDETDIAADFPLPASPVSTTFTAPEEVGTYTVRATEVAGRRRTATAVLAVVDPSAPTTTVPGGSLPRTGTSVWQVSLAAAAAVGAGLFAVWVTRRRRTPTAGC